MAQKRSENLTDGSIKVHLGRAKRLAENAKEAAKNAQRTAKVKARRIARTARTEAKEKARFGRTAARKAKKQTGKQISLTQYYSRMAVIFAVILGVLVVFNFLSKDTDFSAEENRVMATRPDLTSSSFFEGRFSPEYETYVNDQFPARNMWIRIKTTADVLTGKVESNGVYKGHQGYLMEKFTDPGKKKTKKTAGIFTEFIKKHRDLDTYLFAVPTSVNILSDLLPANTDDGGQNEFLDRLFEQTEAGGIKTIDVRKQFRKLAKEKQIYYHSDHHWTSTGAYHGFLAAADVMGLEVDKKNYKPSVVKDDFKGMLASKSGFYMCKKDDIEVYFPTKNIPVSIITYVDDQKKSASFYKAANLEEKDAYTVFTGGNHSLIKIKSAAENEDKLLIIKDSYANCFIPFIAPYYRNVVVVDPRYYFGDLDKLIKSEDITDVLFLYNASTLSTDSALKTMLAY